MPGRVWARRKPEWTSNLAAEPTDLFPLAPFAAQAGIKAVLGVPVLDGEKVLAVLLFYLLEFRQKDSRLVQVVSEVATQLGFALRHKHLEEELERNEVKLRPARGEIEIRGQERTAELERVNELLQAEIVAREQLEESLHVRVLQQAAVAKVGQRALSGIELSPLMEEVTALTAQTLGVEFCKILELLPGDEALRLRAGVGWKEGLVGRAMVNAGIHSQAGYTLLSNAPVIVENLQTETRFSGPPLLHDHGIMSGMSVVIPGNDRPFGVLGAHTIKQRTFSSDDVHFVEAVANVLSEAIERKKAEEEIQRSANWLERLIETSQDAVVSIDRQARIVLFNPGAERIFGYTQAEIRGQKVNVLMAEPYATEHDSYIERYERTGEARAIGRIRTVEARRKNGEAFPIELSVTKVSTVEGEEVQYAAFIRDISEVRRGQAWLQSLIDTTQDAVLSIDRQGRVVLFNPTAERIFGYTRNEIVGQKVNLLMAEPYATEHDGYIEHYERTGEARAIGRIRTVTARRKNGELFPIELSVTKIAEDQDVQYAAFIRDISEKARLQARLVENERLVAIGTTAAKIGHELANPLNGMSLTIQLLEQRLSKRSSLIDAQIASTVSRLKNEVSRLSTLLDQFRSLSRREKFDFQRTTLTALVGEAIEIEMPRYAGLGIQVECSFPSNLPTITVDINKMKQVIFNLTKNAAEAMAGGGRISIKGSASENRIILEISDTGTGIPAGIDIFEPFFTTKPEGTGIGLSIVQQIVSAHGGSVTYRSEHGKGTTFVIALPQK
jgi:PAS domain S-box-containing protein